MNKLFFCLFSALFSVPLFSAAGTPQEMARAKELLSNLESSFPVLPYLPEDYTLIKMNGNSKGGVEANEADEPVEYVWGPKGFDMNQIDNPDYVSKPIIFFVKMPGHNSFKEDMEEMLKELKREFPLETSFFQWGEHSGVALTMRVHLDKVCLAYVDLNNKNKERLLFRLFYAEKMPFGNGNTPSPEVLAFWKDFLEKTKSLN